MSDELKHVTHYLVLFIGLLVFVFLFSVYSHNKNAKALIGFSFSVFYILWGIIHHALDGRLSKLIILEYVLVGLFVFCLFFVALGL